MLAAGLGRRMRPGRFAWVFAGIALAGCQTAAPPDTLLVINNSGQQIVVTSGEDVEAVLEGKSAEVPFAAGSKLVIETAQCKYEYATPRAAAFPQKPDDGRQLAVEMGADAELYALPPDASAPVPLADVEKTQSGEFPLKPSQTTCR